MSCLYVLRIRNNHEYFINLHIIMLIHKYLTNHGFYTFEGYSQEVTGQVNDLISLTSKPNISVMEIGFNAGHSAEIFLKNNPTLNLTSFDLGEHDYGVCAKEYIDMIYPNRHTLILGDSRDTIPKFIKEHPGRNFDVIFIDGGHIYDIANADIVNCQGLAHKDTVVIIDDTCYKDGWQFGATVDVTKAWIDQLDKGLISEIGKNDYQPARGMSWGKYTTASTVSRNSSI